MAAITSIRLRNFKFFQNIEQFDLNSNHLLLYGENGSGKSSLYWALYTLLECANKEDITQIKKYFDPTDEEHLTNIFLDPGTADWVDSLIEVNLNNGTQFKVEFADTSINSKPDARDANFASEFLNYKMLFRLHNFAHSDEVDIFDYFLREVFPYVKYTPVNYWLKNTDGTPNTQVQTDSAQQIWKFVKEGPPKIGRTKGKNTLRYPLRREPAYGEYINVINAFKSETTQLLTTIVTEGNRILQADLDGDFTFNLALVEYRPLKLSELQFKAPGFAVMLTIPSFFGTAGVLKPHTFLNEARLSALGLAIRFAILRQRLQIAELKVAVLDDFMISLDMKNRDVAMNYILDKVAPNYQVVLLTHDRFLYELASDKILRKGQTNWTKYQLFEDKDDPPTKLFPKAILDEGKVNKARALFKDKDFSSSANMIRQAVEKFCRAYLTPQQQLGGDYRPMKLDGQITAVIAKGRAATPPVNAQLLLDLKDYKDRIMNPSSHYDIETPLFSNELDKAITTMEQLSLATGHPL